jgi:hypothetical protein
MITQLYDLLGTKYPFGRGTSGAGSLTSDPHTRRQGNASSGNNTLTLNSGAYSNGDVILAMQIRGLSSAGEQNWELNQITSGGGTASLTLKNNWGRAFTTSGYNMAQVMDVKEYANLSVGSFTSSGWNYSNKTGGLLAFAVAGACEWNGTITNAGYSGGSSMSDQGGKPGVRGGFSGGANSMDQSSAWRGEGYPNTNWPPYEGRERNGNGGGGGWGDRADNGGAGGGGRDAAGIGSPQAEGGYRCGNTALTSAVFGGGGGGGRNDGDQAAGGGGSGGGGIIAWLKVLNLLSGGINLNAGNGGPSSQGATSGGGGGGGGFGLFNVGSGTFSTNFRALKGNGQNTGTNGGNGGFRVNYYTPIIGNTNPAASTALNSKLRVPAGMMQVIG